MSGKLKNVPRAPMPPALLAEKVIVYDGTAADYGLAMHRGLSPRLYHMREGMKLGRGLSNHDAVWLDQQYEALRQRPTLIIEEQT